MGGPAAPSVFNDQEISLARTDEYSRFQSDRAVYHDDVHDYITNEPSISLSATGLLLMAELAQPPFEIDLVSQ